jgi:hypothetical protein
MKGCWKRRDPRKKTNSLAHETKVMKLTRTWTRHFVPPFLPCLVAEAKEERDRGIQHRRVIHFEQAMVSQPDFFFAFQWQY